MAENAGSRLNPAPLEGQWRAHRTDRDKGFHRHEGSANQDERVSVAAHSHEQELQIYKLEKMTTPTTQPFRVRDPSPIMRRPPAKEIKRFLGGSGQALIVWKNELKKA